jgi:hypothetical protein
MKDAHPLQWSVMAWDVPWKVPAADAAKMLDEWWMGESVGRPADADPRFPVFTHVPVKYPSRPRLAPRWQLPAIKRRKAGV